MKPNILWICTDQQRHDTIRRLGNPSINTPHLDALAASGTAFTHAFCQSPVCTPSRASFLTGYYPGRIRASMNGSAHWADAAPLAATYFAKAGYRCALIGKLHLSAAWGRTEQRPVDDGYHTFLYSHAPRDDWQEGHAYANWLREQGQDLATLAQSGEGIPAAYHQTTWCTSEAIRLIETEQQPWFMSVNMFDPHPPFDPPSDYRERYTSGRVPPPLHRATDALAQQALANVDFQSAYCPPDACDYQAIVAAYYAMIELIDTNIGRILAALEATGQRERTLIVFMSDHGEMLGDHGLLLKGCRFYEGLVRVPLIFSMPGVIEEGVERHALVELVDVLPKLLDAGGMPTPDDFHGRSLMPLSKDVTHEDTHRDKVHCAYYHALLPDDTNGFRGSFGTMIRTDTHKLVVYHGTGKGEFFDLVNDPGEFNNLWDHPAYVPQKLDLMIQSFDTLAQTVDRGPQQVAYA